MKRGPKPKYPLETMQVGDVVTVVTDAYMFPRYVRRRGERLEVEFETRPIAQDTYEVRRLA